MPFSSSSSHSSSSASSTSSGKFSASNVVLSTTSFFCLSATRLHTSRFSLRIEDANGVLLPFDQTNVMRVKIGRHNEIPELDLHSQAPTANGSSVTITNPTTLVLDQDDLDFAAGIYDIEIILMDDATGSLVTHLASGILAVDDTQLGDVAVT